MAPQSPSSAHNDQFPRFAGGDVLVAISLDKQYQLDSKTLSMYSSRLASLLTEDNAIKLSSKARKEGTRIRWRVELDTPKSEDEKREVGRVGQVHLRVSLTQTLIRVYR